MGVLISAVLLGAVAGAGRADAWGKGTHRLVNERAAAGLAAAHPEALGFFGKHAAALGKLASMPDAAKRDDPAERIRHYLDVDLLDEPPFAEIPRGWDAVLAKHGEETALDAGRLPWAIEMWVWRLGGAMRAGDGALVLREAAWLGHYGADLAVPLHATVNYNGQLTGNKGVHKRFEVEMVEPHLDGMHFDVPPLEVMVSPLDFTFDELGRSWMHVGAIMDADTAASDADPEYGDAYYTAMWERTGALARERIERAVWIVGSLWLTAWHVAGKPGLQDLWTTP
jgi:hypothetical protein